MVPTGGKKPSTAGQPCVSPGSAAEIRLSKTGGERLLAADAAAEALSQLTPPWTGSNTVSESDRVTGLMAAHQLNCHIVPGSSPWGA